MVATELGLEPHDILMLEGHPSHCFIWGRENNIHQLKRFCASENTHKEPCVFCPRCRRMPARRHIGYIFILMRIHVLSQIFSLRIQSNLCSWPSSPHNCTFAIQLLFYLHFIILDIYSFSCEYMSFLRSFLCEHFFKATCALGHHRLTIIRLQSNSSFIFTSSYWIYIHSHANTCPFSDLFSANSKQLVLLAIIASQSHFCNPTPLLSSLHHACTPACHHHRPPLLPRE
jgi:hypothetical protein